MNQREDEVYMPIVLYFLICPPPKSGAFSHASTLNWGDWHVSMRLHLNQNKKADVTIGRGMPYVWIEPRGIDLKIPGELKKDGT